jgi:hypothetical protein
MNEYIVIEQTKVQAESPSDAIVRKAKGEGNVVSLNAQLRNTPVNPMQGAAQVAPVGSVQR